MEAVLFAAARLDHVEQLIRPALESGAVVLCDRFIDSTRAYQGTVKGLTKAFLSSLEKAAVGETRPNLTIILDIDAEVGLQRASARRGEGSIDRFEKDTIAVHQKRRDAFLAIAAAEPNRCVVIDADRDVEAVFSSIKAAVDAAMERREFKEGQANSFQRELH